MLKQYVKAQGRKGKKVGVLVADELFGEIRVGFAAWKPSDKHNLEFAENLASKRMRDGFGRVQGPAHKIRTPLLFFINRAYRFYKGVPLSGDTSWLFDFCGGEEKLEKIRAKRENV
jgi:hypothetical protein